MPVNQPALPLPATPMPLLREAYERSTTIKKVCTFEQAMRIKRYEICLRCYADALRRARK